MKILVVEDEADIRANVVRMLQLEGFDLVEAANGRIGLEMARTHLPHLIISDVMMPELDGFELLETLRADPTTMAIPVIFLTARADRSDRRRGMNLGADDYLGKPFSRDELLDAVTARIKRTQAMEKSAPASSPAKAAETDKSPPPAEVSIKGYQLLRLLGTGGMSQVFLAKRISDGKEMALKILDTQANQDSSFLDRFIQEYALLEQIDHPNVARIYGHGFTDEHAFITMEYFDQGDIKGRIAQGLSPFDALAVVYQVALALEAVHALGIVHRDVKPSNLMLRADGSVALIDFGVAKDAAQSFEQTRHGEIVGSPYYMSPEQARGKPVNPSSDLYCLGVILYEMISGKKPFVADHLEALLYQHVHAPPPRFEAKFAEFQSFLDVAMHKDPKQRFASAKAMAETISTCWPTVIRLIEARTSQRST